ncbi:60S ribosomal protein L23a [Galemys pyrenaicus]|uniref:60S ribosomal protein L23a n=1 Tax=Galemys pyrenaicus TaxID=202257 RepID=A0A8J6AFI8_GALPY|nr:60S ribosomal protein L23a [Galemys pyrenaicus]
MNKQMGERDSFSVQSPRGWRGDLENLRCSAQQKLKGKGGTPAPTPVEDPSRGREPVTHPSLAKSVRGSHGPGPSQARRGSRAAANPSSPRLCQLGQRSAAPPARPGQAGGATDSRPHGGHPSAYLSTHGSSSGYCVGSWTALAARVPSGAGYEALSAAREALRPERAPPSRQPAPSQLGPHPPPQAPRPAPFCTQAPPLLRSPPTRLRLSSLYTLPPSRLFFCNTKSAMKKIEDNTLVFMVDVKVNMHHIKQAVKKLCDIDMAKVNTLIKPDGEKKASS